ncbi:unnamed protein product [Clonostachys byssicola]|uniref:Uncharacterized protein n=1 Tax=Clonostachys byssicola TaxID=160290 RepID=A0A9N9UBW5_9HYPO|nr:unnamed protein product [Clonostachys byssicola]
MTTASNWLPNWALAYATPYIVGSGPGNADLQSKVFFNWASFCLIDAVFVYLYIYETKAVIPNHPNRALSLEEVDELFDTVSVAWKSKHFTPTVHFADMFHERDSKGEAKDKRVEDVLRAAA